MAMGNVHKFVDQIELIAGGAASAQQVMLALGITVYLTKSEGGGLSIGSQS
jgi:hypothetical protein